MKWLNILVMVIGEEDHVMGVSSLANEEPLGVMKGGIYIVWEVIQQYHCDGGDSVIWQWETALGHGGYGCVLQWLSCI